MNIIEENRGFNKKLMLFPGWGFDHKMFLDLDLEYDLIYYDELDLELINEKIYEYIQSCNDDIYILAWSMGCQVFNRFIEFFANKKDNQILAGKIKRIFLLSCIEKFDFPAAKEFQNDLDSDFKKWLIHFYRRVFLGDKPAWKEFEKKYLDSYIKKYSEKKLFDQLQFLIDTELSADNFKQFNMKIMASSNDIITPLDKVQEYAGKIGINDFETFQACHALFTNQEVISEINKR